MTKTRIANRRYTSPRQRPASAGAGWLTVVVGFVIICGLLLLLLGRGAGCADGGDRRAAAAQQVLDALKQANKADQALEQKNYGEARYYVKSAQEKLTGALTELQGAVDR